MQRISGAKLDGALLDRAWALKSNFSNVTFKGASLLESQMMDAKSDGADFSGARLAPNMSRASFVKARFDGADLSGCSCADLTAPTSLGQISTMPMSIRPSSSRCEVARVPLISTRRTTWSRPFATERSAGDTMRPRSVGMLTSLVAFRELISGK